MKENEAGNVHVATTGEAYDSGRERDFADRVRAYHRDVLVPLYKAMGIRCPPAPGIESSL